MPILPPTHTPVIFVSIPHSPPWHTHTHTQHDKTQTHMVRQGMHGASHKMWAYHTLNQHTTHAVPRYYSSGCSVCNIMACLFMCERPLCTLWVPQCLMCEPTSICSLIPIFVLTHKNMGGPITQNTALLGLLKSAVPWIISIATLSCPSYVNPFHLVP